MLLLVRGLALPEQAWMGIVLTKRRAALADLVALYPLLIRLKAAAFRAGRRFSWPVIVDRIRLVVRWIGIDIHAVHTVPLEVVVRAGRAVNRDFMEVWPAQAADLRIGIGEETTLQQRIVSKI